MNSKRSSKNFAWSGFSIKGKTSLFCFRNIMDAPLYVLILQKHIPEISEMMRSQWRLQQDNDPKHTSRLAKEFLEKNVSQVIVWPANNPDVNPIKIYGVLLN